MLRVRTVMTGIAGSPYYSNLYFGGSTEAEAITALDAVYDWWESMTSAICTPLRFDVEGEVPVISETTGDILNVHQLTTVGVPFTGAGEAAPVSSQLLAQMYTGVYVNGRQLRGRMFIPYVTITQIDDGRVQQAAITTIEGRLATLLANGVAAGGLVVWSRTHGRREAVTQIRLWNQFAVLRSRRD